MEVVGSLYKRMQLRTLRDSFYYDFITDFFMWIRLPVEVQKAAIALIHKMHDSGEREMSVQKTLSVVRLFYWLYPVRGGLSSPRDPRANLQELCQLRRALFDIVASRLVKGATRDDVVSLVNFVFSATVAITGTATREKDAATAAGASSSQQKSAEKKSGGSKQQGQQAPPPPPPPPSNLEDVTVGELDELDDADLPSALRIVISVLEQLPRTFSELFFECKGVEALMQALYVPSEKVRVLAVEALSRLSYILMGPSAMKEGVRSYMPEIASSLAYVLSHVPGGLTENVYAALVRMATSDFSRGNVAAGNTDKGPRLTFPEVFFMCIFPLMKGAAAELRLRAYGDFEGILKKRLNCRKVLNFVGWQFYLCRAMDGERRMATDETRALACTAFGRAVQHIALASVEYMYGWEPMRTFFAILGHYDSYVGGDSDFFAGVQAAYARAFMAVVVAAIKGEGTDAVRIVINPASDHFPIFVSLLVQMVDFHLVYSPSVCPPYIHSDKFLLKNISLAINGDDFDTKGSKSPAKGASKSPSQGAIQSLPSGPESLSSSPPQPPNTPPSEVDSDDEEEEADMLSSPNARPGPPSVPPSPEGIHAMSMPFSPLSLQPKDGDDEDDGDEGDDEGEGEEGAVKTEEVAGTHTASPSKEKAASAAAAATVSIDRTQCEIIVLSQILGYMDHYHLPNIPGWGGAEKNKLASPVMRTRAGGFAGLCLDICVRLAQIFATIGSVDQGKKCYAAMTFLGILAARYVPQHGSVQAPFYFILDTAIASFGRSIRNKEEAITKEIFTLIVQLTKELGRLKKLSKFVSKPNCAAVTRLIETAQGGSAEALAAFLDGDDAWKRAGAEVHMKAQSYIMTSLNTYDKTLNIRADAMLDALDLLKICTFKPSLILASDSMYGSVRDDTRRVEKLSRKLSDINDEGNVNENTTLTKILLHTFIFFLFHRGYGSRQLER